MFALRRKTLFSIFHHPCAWANSPWLTECESNSFGPAAKEKWSQILFWKRKTPLWWRWLVDGSRFFWSSLSPSFSSLELSSWKGPALPKAGSGDECCVFRVNRSWFLGVHGGVTARARLPHALKLDLTPCLLWRWNPWQVIILLSHIISDVLSTGLPAKSQLLGSEKEERRSSESPDKPRSGRLQPSPEFSLGFIAKQGMQVF